MGRIARAARTRPGIHALQRHRQQAYLLLSFGCHIVEDCQGPPATRDTGKLLHSRRLPQIPRQHVAHRTHHLRQRRTVECRGWCLRRQRVQVARLHKRCRTGIRFHPRRREDHAHVQTRSRRYALHFGNRTRIFERRHHRLYRPAVCHQLRQLLRHQPHRTC